MDKDPITSVTAPITPTMLLEMMHLLDSKDVPIGGRKMRYCREGIYYERDIDTGVEEEIYFD